MGRLWIGWTKWICLLDDNLSYHLPLPFLTILFILMSLYEEHTNLLQKAGVTFEPLNLATITDHDVLLLIDCQNDFFPADFVEDGGRFGVAVGFRRHE